MAINPPSDNLPLACLEQESRSEVLLTELPTSQPMMFRRPHFAADKDNFLGRPRR